jgi:ligand-binding sensor domain-containing protein/serine phosphatase RsbU (regulator of sigma subunit)
MSAVINRKIIFSTIMCLFLFSVQLNAQTFRFRNYGPDSKIPNRFIYTINQDNNGYLWVGTGKGLSKFDGFEFYNVGFPDSVTSRFATSAIKDKNGTLWFGCNDGTVFYTTENGLMSLDLSNNKTISAVLEGPDGFIYIFPQGGEIFKVNPIVPSEIKSYSVDPDLVLLSACFTQTGDILIGTQGSIKILRIDGDTIAQVSTIEGFDYYSVISIQKLKDKNSFLLGTNGNGLFHLAINQDESILEHLSYHKDLDMLNVQSISEDHDNNIWLATNESGIIQLKLYSSGQKIEFLRVFDKNSGLPGNNARIVFQDIEGNYWIGLFGNGLSVLNSLAFSFYSPGTTPESNNIIYIRKFSDEYFLGTPIGFYLFDFKDNKIKSFTDLSQKTGKNEIASYCVDDEDNIWIGTKGAGLFVMNRSGNMKQFYKSGNSGEDYVTDVKVSGKYIWIGSLNGVRILNRETGARKALYNIDNGLPHNLINQIFITNTGNAAIATKTDRLFLINPEKGIIQGKAVMYGTTMNEIKSFSQSKDGNLWASTYGNGVFEFYGDSLKSFTRADMIMSDYCYSILVDSVNRVWIGHAMGFSRYNRNTGIIRTYGADFARSGYCNPGGMYESPDGIVFIGTTAGVIVYDMRKDFRPQVAPFNNVNFVEINNVKYPYKPSYTLPYNKRYNIWVNYVGINLRDPDKVYYETILENYNTEWSKMSTQREVLYPPRDGHYKFMMKSVNEDGLSQDTPISFNLIIKKPFYRSWWFIITVLGLITGIVMFIVREREKSQKKIQAYLESELAARTSVVMKQKGEIELQNIEITDSINYAKRIQTSILPDFNKLAGIFADAFILFRPRDIVSGDFYWFDKFDNDRYIIVCADSTGHGVPGAFMSMIGATLLQDIITRQRISKPSEILKMLDTQIFATLNQNVELGVSNDGMDMVVCEISVKTRHIKFASAMRPVILVLGGESYYIKGNRSSVGGESVIEKYFDDQEYYLNKGDTIYMFSDGLPDQFGGTDGKKMKIARLKKLIEDVANLPMSGQKEVIASFYEEWKGDYDQVDDILLIGVRL